MNITSNVDLSDHQTAKVQFQYTQIDKSSYLRLISTIKSIVRTRPDAVLLFNPTFFDIIVGTILSMNVLHKTKLFYFDLTLKKPITTFEKIAARVKGSLLNRAQSILLVHKDIDGYERHYGLNRKIVSYIPFKSNCYEDLKDISITEGNYMLSCGASHRDYNTLIKAAHGLSINIRIVVPEKSQAQLHRTLLDSDISTDDNVEIHRHDFNQETWRKHIANCFAVVIPIEKDCIQAAGISVYLEAMSLGKPVIITKSVSTNMLISTNEAYLVNGGDVASLRRAIIEISENSDLRARIARGGQDYALSLKGTDRLVSDIVDRVQEALDASLGSESA